MRSTRVNYHRAVKDTRSKENDMRKAEFAESIVSNKNRDFWKEINKIKSSRKTYQKLLMNAIMRVILQMCLLINT